MAYYDAISNAIAARGNALAQAAQQQGQVYGNLASNLGQLPFQAMQAGQRRRALEVETQHRAAQTQTIQNELDFQKEAYATMSRKDLSPEQLDMEMGNILKKFGKFQEFEALQSRKMQTAVNKYNVLKGGPGASPPGGFALPEPTQGVTQPGMGVANAFAPVVPRAQQMMNPEVDIPGIGALRPPTAGDIELQKQRADEAASAVDLQRQQTLQRSGIEGQKEVASFQAGLRTNKPLNMSDLEGYVENMAQEHQRMTGQEATPGQRATWLREIMLARAQAGVQGSPSQLLGFDAQGKPVSYVPDKRGGGGAITTASGGPPGPLTPKVSQPVSDKAQQSITGALNAMNLLNQLESLTPKVTSETPVYNYLSGAAKQLGVKAGFSGESQQFEDLVGQLRVSAQDIIKGIPSNFDVQTFIATLPQLTQGTPRALNNIRLAKEKLTREFTNQIAYFKGSNKIIPDEILDQARNLGIDVDAVPSNANPWSRRTGGSTAAPVGGQPKILKIERIQ